MQVLVLGRHSLILRIKREDEALTAWHAAPYLQTLPLLNAVVPTHWLVGRNQAMSS